MNHLMIDCYHASEDRMDDLKTINSVLNEIVLELNLDSAMPPFLLPYYYAKESEDDGISAFVILVGGHITIHTFPHRRCFFMDILYDGYFDENKLCAILRNTFNVSEQYSRSLRTERRYFDMTIPPEKIWKGDLDNTDFGPHTIARVDDVDVGFEQMYDLLDCLPDEISMLSICRPCMIKTKGYLSGLVLIAQSHIAFHYSIEERSLFCDLFSCSFYMADAFTEKLKHEFGKKPEAVTLIRGSKHENNIERRNSKIKLLGMWRNW